MLHILFRRTVALSRDRTASWSHVCAPAVTLDRLLLTVAIHVTPVLLLLSAIRYDTLTRRLAGSKLVYVVGAQYGSFGPLSGR